MKVMIYNPKFPKDMSKAKDLTREQFAVVHNDIVKMMNGGPKVKDADVIAKLEQAGKPIKFD